MATDSTSTSGAKGPDVLVSTVTALTTSGAWVTWSGYRAASKTKGRPDYYICSLPLNNTSAASSYSLVEIGAQAKADSVQLTVIALGAGSTAQLVAPNGTVTPLSEGVTVTVAGSTSTGGAVKLQFTGDCCAIKVVRPTTTTTASTLSATSETTLEDGEGDDPPPPYPGSGSGN